jgi:hypothetical protein
MADGCETGDVRHIQKNEDLETNPANQFGYDSALNASKPIDFPVICTCKTRVSPCHCSKKTGGPPYSASGKYHANGPRCSENLHENVQYCPNIVIMDPLSNIGQSVGKFEVGLEKNSHGPQFILEVFSPTPLRMAGSAATVGRFLGSVAESSRMLSHRAWLPCEPEEK